MQLPSLTALTFIIYMIIHTLSQYIHKYVTNVHMLLSHIQFSHTTLTHIHQDLNTPAVTYTFHIHILSFAIAIVLSLHFSMPLSWSYVTPHLQDVWAGSLISYLLECSGVLMDTTTIQSAAGFHYVTPHPINDKGHLKYLSPPPPPTNGCVSCKISGQTYFFPNLLAPCLNIFYSLMKSSNSWLSHFHYYKGNILWSHAGLISSFCVQECLSTYLASKKSYIQIIC